MPNSHRPAIDARIMMTLLLTNNGKASIASEESPNDNADLEVAMGGTRAAPIATPSKAEIRPGREEA